MLNMPPSFSNCYRFFVVFVLQYSVQVSCNEFMKLVTAMFRREDVPNK